MPLVFFRSPLQFLVSVVSMPIGLDFAEEGVTIAAPGNISQKGGEPNLKKHENWEILGKKLGNFDNSKKWEGYRSDSTQPPSVGLPDEVGIMVNHGIVLGMDYYCFLGFYCWNYLIKKPICFFCIIEDNERKPRKFIKSFF